MSAFQELADKFKAAEKNPVVLSWDLTQRLIDEASNAGKEIERLQQSVSDLQAELFKIKLAQRAEASQLREKEGYDICSIPEPVQQAVAVLLRFYVHETDTLFGVAQMPGPTPTDVDQAWWTLASHDRPGVDKIVVSSYEKTAASR